jgi:DHA3 family macrolide efflux protein-like MFS transporter
MDSDRNGSPPDAGTFINSNFLLLIQGSWVNQVGTQIALVATAVWLRRSTNSASLLGLLATTSAVPMLLLSPLGGAFADRWFRRNSLIFWDVLSGLVSCGLVFLIASKSLILTYGVIGIFIGALFLSSANAFTTPAFNALIPDVVGPAHLPKAMAFTQASSLIAIICGQALGGLLVVHYEPHVLFGIDAATYFFSAMAECFVRSTALPAKMQNRANALKKLWTEIQEGVVYVWQRRGMRVLLLATIPMNLFTSPIFVFLPFYTTNGLGEPLSKYGYLLAIFSLGLLIGYGLAGKLRVPVDRISSVVFGSVFGNAIICLLLSSTRRYWLASMLLFLFGSCTGIVTLLCLNAVISRTEADKRGRVSAILIMISQGITPLAMSLMGFIGDILHGNVRPLYAGCGAVLLVMGVFLFSNRDLRRFFEGLPERVALSVPRVQ